MMIYYARGKLKKLFIILSLFTLSIGQDYSLQFDGVDDYVNLGQINSITYNSFSIESWVLINGSTGANQPLISKTIANTNDHQFILETASNGKNIQFVINSHQGNQQHVSYANAISFNEWTHLAVNYSPDVLELTETENLTSNLFDHNLSNS